MSTVVASPRTAAAVLRDRRRFAASRRALAIAASGLSLVGLGAWLLVDRASGTTEQAVSATPIPTWLSPIPPWLSPVDVVGLQRQLVRAGYSIRVDGILDPVTKSALADFLRPSRRHPLNASLAAALDGTVITTRRNPTTWNMRFGLNRRTRLVERPLIGPDGQLDADGNLRALR